MLIEMVLCGMLQWSIYIVVVSMIYRLLLAFYPARIPRIRQRHVDCRSGSKAGIGFLVIKCQDLISFHIRSRIPDPSRVLDHKH